MYKRIIALFLVALTLIFSIPLTAFAEEEVPAFSWADLDKTTIKTDLGDYDFSKYEKDSSILNPSIITVAEKGFSANMDYTKCALYLYIHIPMADEINLKSVLNKVQINNGKYSLVYIDKEGESVFKYKVNAPVSFFEKLNTKSRVYEIASLEFGPASNLPTPKDYKIGGKYTFEGLDGNVALKSVETFEVVRLDINYTTFRNTSEDYAEGVFNQLTSVYFSIPNYILERYDNQFYGIDCTYERYYTRPMVVSRSKAVCDEILKIKPFSLKADKISMASDSPLEAKTKTYYYSSDYSVGLCIKRTVSGVSHGVYTYYDFMYNINPISSAIASADCVAPQYIPFAFHYDKQFDSNFWINKETVQSAIEKKLFTYSTPEDLENLKLYGYDYYDPYLFEDYYYNEGKKVYIFGAENDEIISGSSPKVDKSITVDDKPYNMVSYSDTHSDFRKLLDFGLKAFIVGIKNDETYEAKAIERIKSSEYKNLTAEEFSQKYLVDKNEVAEVMTNVAKGEAKDETTYIFRLDVAPYRAISVDAYAEGCEGQNTDTFVCQEPVYMGFDVFALTFIDKDGEKVKVAVSSDPENLVGGLEPDPESTLEGDFKNWWENLKKTMGNIFSIIFLLIIVSIAIAFFPTIRDFLASLINGLATGIDGATRPKYTGNESKKRKRRKRK